MKWTREREFSRYEAFFMEHFSKEKDYIVYGVGMGFESMYRLLHAELNLIACVDGDQRKQGTTVHGVMIHSPEWLRQEKLGDDVRVIIAPGGDMYTEVQEKLQAMGIDGRNICGADEILSLWGWHYQKKICTSFTSLYMTNCCTLRCKDCLPYVPYHKHREIYGLEEIKRTVDSLFRVFDYISLLELAGGEPLLNKYLGGGIRYIAEHYAGRYAKLRIVTNGTLVPDDETLKKIRDAGTFVFISDYTGLIGERSKARQLAELLEQYGVEYQIITGFGQSDHKFQWFDMGDPSAIKDSVRVRERFEQCSLVCHIAHDERWYYCNPAFGAEIGELYEGPWESNYLDLSKLGGMRREEYAASVLKFNLGFPENGFISHCRRCNGFGKKVNSHFVPAGQQIDVTEGI